MTNSLVAHSPLGWSGVVHRRAAWGLGCRCLLVVCVHVFDSWCGVSGGPDGRARGCSCCCRCSRGGSGVDRPGGVGCRVCGGGAVGGTAGASGGSYPVTGGVGGGPVGCRGAGGACEYGGVVGVDDENDWSGGCGSGPAGGNVTPAERDRVEAGLVTAASRLDPDRLRRASRTALAFAERDAAQVAEHEAHLVRDEQQRARRLARLTIRDNGDGTSSGWFTIPTLAASILTKAIQQLASPRRSSSTVTRDTTEHTPADSGGGQATSDWAHASGLAFTDLLPAHPQSRRDHRRHHRSGHPPHRPRGRPGRYRADDHRRTGPAPGLHCGDRPRRPRRRITPTRPRPDPTVLHRSSTHRVSDPVHRMRRHRL